MIVSSILNPITCKQIDSNEPNQWNTLHADLKEGSTTILNYSQKFNKDMVVYEQFVSPDSNTVPILTFYFSDGTTKVETGTLDRTITGDQTRYFFNFEITLGSDYYNKCTYFIVSQDGTNYLKSEPIYTYDMTSDISDGLIKKIVYSNYDRIISDLNGYYIDFSIIDNTDNELAFYVEGVMKKQNPESESDVLEQSETESIISSVSKSGVILETDIIPPYMHYKIQSAAGLDYFEINGREYIAKEIDQEPAGESTSISTSLTLSDKYVLGLNTDETGTETVTTSEIMNLEFAGKSTDFDFERPEGYSLHQILVKHTGASNTATIICGNSLGGEEYIDSFSGNVPYSTSLANKAIPHHTPTVSSGRIYIGISGTGVVLTFYVQLLKITA